MLLWKFMDFAGAGARAELFLAVPALALELEIGPEHSDVIDVGYGEGVRQSVRFPELSDQHRGSRYRGSRYRVRL
jgi:hypothetical protein